MTFLLTRLFLDRFWITISRENIFAKLVIGLQGFFGSLNSREIKFKNKLVCENAVTRIYGS